MMFTMHDLMIDVFPETAAEWPAPPDPKAPPPRPKPGPKPAPTPQCQPITIVGPGYFAAASVELSALAELREQLRQKMRL